MSHLKLLTVLVSLVSLSANAGSWEQRRSALEKVAVFDEFRVFYSLSGKDKLPKSRRVDDDRNGVPDFIDNIGRRIVLANQVFSDDVGLTPPLNSRRYKGQAHHIDLHVLDFSVKKKGPKNGVAYDGTPKFDRSKHGLASSRVLAIDISATVSLNSHTVEHELFHLYQNGYTYFKNRWYTEGTARWSESLINKRIGRTSKLPSSKAEKEKLLRETYNASSFWNQLITTLDNKHLGKQYIKHLLEELDRIDDIAARSRNISLTNWQESEQKSEKNNVYIWQAINNVNKKYSQSKKISALNLL